MDKYIQKVKDHGGTIIMPKTSIPGFGYLATFLYTEGKFARSLGNLPK